jgi:NADH-quinone oxidoreductase subunit L
MLEFLWLIPSLPFAGFLILALAGRRLPAKSAAFIGVISVGISALVALMIGYRFITSPPAGNSYTQVLWTWMRVGGFAPEIAFYLDALSLVMILVVTFVSFLIHLYSVEFMEDDEGYSRFFAYMNLFVGFMLMLVLADNMVLLYLGWEGVGLCSYLLIGFWYKDPANGRAAIKAFVVTRIGDASMAVGLFLLFTALGTLQIQEILRLALQKWPAGSGLAVASAALLLGGAIGKSAQLPLQTWLPDAMAGPTPVSALIHAATMVTAGVYLIARTHVLFALAPAVQAAVAVIGAVTLLIAGFSALTQRDIKRVLAYSTISQIGYMFLALGVGAWSAAIFHFMTHAFFKALLFLGAGAVILGLNQEHDMYKMGGLRKQLPVTFWTFLIGAASLSALPLITAGFYSKDMILWQVWASDKGNFWLLAAGLTGAFLTSIYTFRMLFLTFAGNATAEVTRKPGILMTLPLITLAVLSVSGGFIEIPETLGNLPMLTGFLHTSLPAAPISYADFHLEGNLQFITSLLSLIGIIFAYRVFLHSPQHTGHMEKILRSPIMTAIHCFISRGWNVDLLYDTFIVQPFIRAARFNRKDFIDLIYMRIARLSHALNRILSFTQSGKVRWYVAGIAVGAIILIGIVELI